MFFPKGEIVNTESQMLGKLQMTMSAILATIAGIAYVVADARGNLSSVTHLAGMLVVLFGVTSIAISYQMTVRLWRESHPRREHDDVSGWQWRD